MTSSNILNPQQKLDLASMIKANDTIDCTQEIREKKQSVIIKTDVDHLVFLKKKYERLRKSNPNEFDAICVKQCAFLFNNYTELYNKIKNDNLDIKILERFLNILKKIEDGELDQHEGSYMVGKHLKEMYVDSALRTQAKIDSQDRNKKIKNKPKQANIKQVSYKDYKLMQTH
jgi:hypothetical protein